MRLLPDDERGEWLRAMRERARRDAEALTPRPGQPIYGLAAPALTPAAVTQYQLSDEKWTAVTLTYGQSDAQEGPYVAVTTMATDAATMPRAESGPTQRDGLEAELRYAVRDECDRAAGSSAPARPSHRNRSSLPGKRSRPARRWSAAAEPCGQPGCCPRIPRIVPLTASS